MFDDPQPGDVINTSHLNGYLEGVAVGDRVKRILAGVPFMELRVTQITEDRIICGHWEFDLETGAEIDEDLGWGRGHSGSFIVKA